MAFLEQPYVKPVRATNTDQTPVNYNLMKSFDKLDKDDVRNNSKHHCIIWVPGEAHQAGQSIIWRYDDEKCRDEDYAELIEKICISLGSN